MKLSDLIGWEECGILIYLPRETHHDVSACMQGSNFLQLNGIVTYLVIILVFYLESCPQSDTDATDTDWRQTKPLCLRLERDIIP